MFNYVVDYSMRFTSKIPGLSPEGLQIYVQQFGMIDDLISCDITETSNERQNTCRDIASRIFDINGVVHFPGASYTLLHKAVEKKNSRFVKILLELNADPDTKDEAGVCARDLAQKVNSQEIVSLISLKKPIENNEKILLTKTLNVDFNLTSQHPLMIQTHSELMAVTQYSATFQFGDAQNERVMCTFSIFSHSALALPAISSPITIHKLKNLSTGTLGYKFKLEFPSNKNLTVFPSLNSGYTFTSQNFICQQREEEKKEDQSCSIS